MAHACLKETALGNAIFVQQENGARRDALQIEEPTSLSKLNDIPVSPKQPQSSDGLDLRTSTSRRCRRRKELNTQKKLANREDYLSRNRVAASKCRARKKKDTDDLLRRLSKLAEQNLALKTELRTMTDDVLTYKSALLEHSTKHSSIVLSPEENVPQSTSPSISDSDDGGTIWSELITQNTWDQYEENSELHAMVAGSDMETLSSIPMSTSAFSSELWRIIDYNNHAYGTAETQTEKETLSSDRESGYLDPTLPCFDTVSNEGLYGLTPYPADVGEAFIQMQYFQESTIEPAILAT